MFSGFISAWKTMGLFVLDFRDLSVKLVMFNMIWCVTSLLIVTLPISTLALVAVCADLKDRKDVSWRDFFRYFRMDWLVGLRWGVLNVIVFILLIANFWFYGRLEPNLRTIIHTIWLIVAIIWILVQFYTLPLLFHQEEFSLRTALRNALVLIIRYPIYTLSYAIVALVFLFMSAVVPYFWLIFTASFLVLLYLHAVDFLVKLEIDEAPDLDKELAQN